MESIKTAYSTAYNRMILQAKSGKIGDIVSVDAVCTSMREFIQGNLSLDSSWNSICAWGPTALLPIFQLFGTDYKRVNIISKRLDTDSKFDGFTKIDFLFKNGVASAKVAKSAKSEGELVISGTKGYIYVPAPWWKTDYYEIRFENPEKKESDKNLSPSLAPFRKRKTLPISTKTSPKPSLVSWKSIIRTTSKKSKLRLLGKRCLTTFLIAKHRKCVNRFMHININKGGII